MISLRFLTGHIFGMDSFRYFINLCIRTNMPRRSKKQMLYPSRVSRRLGVSRTSRGKGRGSATRGWSKEKPSRHERTVMRHRCGSTCFLGPGTSFPICKRNTCTISPRGVHAAYGRAREWKHDKVASRAKRLMK